MKCKICSSDRLFELSSIYDDRYGYPGIFSLVNCCNCSHIFLSAEFSQLEISRLYSNYYPRASYNLHDRCSYKESVGVWDWLDGERSSAFRWVPRNVRVLDIGCGFGESLSFYKSRGCDGYGVEADNNILRVADEFGYNARVGLFDPNSYEESYFDYVTMSQVIEHVIDPVQTLCGIYRVLKPGGIVILSTPNVNGWGRTVFGRYWINWHAPYHLNLFSYKSMSLAVNQAGLIIDKVLTITPSAWLFYQWIHLGTYPNEGRPSVFWAYKANKTILQKVYIKFFTLLHMTKLNHLITRLFDALGAGDSCLYFIRKPF